MSRPTTHADETIVVRFELWRRIIVGTCFAIFILLSLTYPLESATIGNWVFCLCISAISAMALRFGMRGKLVVSSDRLEVTRWWRSAIVERTDIESLRIVPIHSKYTTLYTIAVTSKNRRRRLVLTPTGRNTRKGIAELLRITQECRVLLDLPTPGDDELPAWANA